MRPGRVHLPARLSARDLVELKKKHGKTGSTDNMDFVREVLSRSICADDGTLLFEDAQDVQESFGLSIGTMASLSERILAVSGLGGEEKNSPQPIATC